MKVAMNRGANEVRWIMSSIRLYQIADKGRRCERFNSHSKSSIMSKTRMLRLHWSILVYEPEED